MLEVPECSAYTEAYTIDRATLFKSKLVDCVTLVNGVMEFVLESVNSVGVRCGKLMLTNGLAFETPMCLTYTRGGAVPHVTQEVLHQAFATSGLGLSALQMNTRHMTLPSL